MYETSDFGASWSINQRLETTDKAGDNEYGWTLSVYSDVLVVGALFDDHKGTNSGKLKKFVYKLNNIHLFFVFWI